MGPFLRLSDGLQAREPVLYTGARAEPFDLDGETPVTEIEL